MTDVPSVLNVDRMERITTLLAVVNFLILMRFTYAVMVKSYFIGHLIAPEKKHFGR